MYVNILFQLYFAEAKGTLLCARFSTNLIILNAAEIIFTFLTFFN